MHAIILTGQKMNSSKSLSINLHRFIDLAVRFLKCIFGRSCVLHSEILPFLGRLTTKIAFVLVETEFRYRSVCMWVFFSN